VNNIIYIYKNKIYLNLTNRCTSRCIYCIKNKWNWWFRGYNLRLKKEPTEKEVFSAISKFFENQKSKKYKEVVFCGYGEPLIRLNLIKKIAKYLKNKNFIIRINTNGHGNLIHKRNICPELTGIIDKISISLNGCSPELYYKLNRPKFGKKTFNQVIKFIKESKKYIQDVTVTSIQYPEINLLKCKHIAKKIGVKFIIRPFLNEYQKK